MEIPTSTGLSKHTFTLTQPTTIGSQSRPSPVQLQAAVSRWLDDNGDDEYQGLSPHNGQSKLWSCWWHPTTTGGILTIGLAHQLLSERLMRRAAAATEFRLGQHRFIIAPEQLTHTHEEMLWPDLAALPTPNRVTVKFLTPTTLRTQKQTTPWMAPASILSSLSSRQSAILPGITFPNPSHEERASLWISDVRGQTKRITFPIGKATTLPSSKSPRKTLSIPGFTGQITYRGENPEILARFNALLHMAEFLGVGARTEYGFGKVEIVRESPRKPGKNPRNRHQQTRDSSEQPHNYQHQHPHNHQHSHPEPQDLHQDNQPHPPTTPQSPSPTEPK